METDYKGMYRGGIIVVALLALGVFCLDVLSFLVSHFAEPGSGIEMLFGLLVFVLSGGLVVGFAILIVTAIDAVSKIGSNRSYSNQNVMTQFWHSIFSKLGGSTNGQ